MAHAFVLCHRLSKSCAGVELSRQLFGALLVTLASLLTLEKVSGKGWTFSTSLSFGLGTKELMEERGIARNHRHWKKMHLKNFMFILLGTDIPGPRSLGATPRRGQLCRVCFAARVLPCFAFQKARTMKIPLWKQSKHSRKESVPIWYVPVRPRHHAGH